MKATSTINELNENIKLAPLSGETPAAYSERLSYNYSSNCKYDIKRDIGQFFTPLKVALFMANLANIKKNKVKILDPGCGTGILSCALIEALADKGVNEFELVSYETDANIIELTKLSYDYLAVFLKTKNKNLSFSIKNEDFILDNSNVLDDSDFLFKEQYETFDVIISNPPYFKINLNDIRSKRSNSIVHGQPNIYAIFLAISAKLLNREGELIFINPRSFAAGYYFKLFRDYFFKEIKIGFIHLFNSRKEHFKKEDVLQELVIIKGNKRIDSKNKDIVISSSKGESDLEKSKTHKYSETDLIDLKSDNKILFLPISKLEYEVICIFKNWRYKLKDFNIKISTGPVVGFRAKNIIFETEQNNMVPLLWMHNINKMQIDWPLNRENKGQYILSFDEHLPILTKNDKNLILLRRFSTKDDKSRLIAAPLSKSFFKTDYIGIENKLNYIYKEHGELTEDESYGLCVLLNSSLFNLYFQTFNGNINVSATEIRDITFPSLEKICEIGHLLKKINTFDQKELDKIVLKSLNLERFENLNEKN